MPTQPRHGTDAPTCGAGCAVARLTALALLLGTLMPAAALTAAAKKTVTTPNGRRCHRRPATTWASPMAWP
ncbi:MAG: hypothetical protein U0Y82_07445 [Thermoleophilia bacterium]